MSAPIDMSYWVFRRFRSERSGLYRINLVGNIGESRKETSAISAIDTEAQVVTTVNGSRYRLVGPWVYASNGGAPQTLADILAWYGEWTPAEPRVTG